MDHIDCRLEFARSFAQVETANLTQVDDIVQRVKKTTEFLGATSASGRWAPTLTARSSVRDQREVQAARRFGVALNWCIDPVRKGGNVGVVGAFGPLFSAVKFGDAMNKGLTIRTDQCPVNRMPRLFEHVRNDVLSRPPS